MYKIIKPLRNDIMFKNILKKLGAFILENTKTRCAERKITFNF
jgi:hypothetical protein